MQPLNPLSPSRKVFKIGAVRSNLVTFLQKLMPTVALISKLFCLAHFHIALLMHKFRDHDSKNM